MFNKRVLTAVLSFIFITVNCLAQDTLSSCKVILSPKLKQLGIEVLDMDKFQEDKVVRIFILTNKILPENTSLTFLGKKDCPIWKYNNIADCLINEESDIWEEYDKKQPYFKNVIFTLPKGTYVYHLILYRMSANFIKTIEIG